MTASGKWTITMRTPLGAQAATVDLKEANGELTGHLESKLGSGAIAEGKASGNSLSWACTFKYPVETVVRFAASLDGNAISGTVDLGRIGKAPFKGERA